LGPFPQTRETIKKLFHGGGRVDTPVFIVVAFATQANPGREGNFCPAFWIRGLMAKWAGKISSGQATFQASDLPRGAFSPGPGRGILYRFKKIPLGPGGFFSFLRSI